jgi:hypothetical protein
MDAPNGVSLNHIQRILMVVNSIFIDFGVLCFLAFYFRTEYNTHNRPDYFKTQSSLNVTNHMKEVYFTFP